MKAKKFLAAIISLAMMCAGATVSYADDVLPSTGPDANIGTQSYETLKDAFENVKSGDTITLNRDVEVNSAIIVDMTGKESITLDGNSNTITFSITNPENNANGDGLRFNGMTSTTNVNIKDLKIAGTARIGINFRGAGTANLTNVNATGTYYGGWKTNGTEYTWGAVNWTNNCGGTVTDCDIVSGFANGDYTYPLILKGSTKFGTLFANAIQGENPGQAKVKAEADGDKKPEISKLIIGKYTDNVSTIMIDKDVWQYVKDTDVEGGAKLVAEVNDVRYTSLADAFAAAKKGDTITLIDDVTVTEQILVENSTLWEDFTLDGGDKTLTVNVEGKNAIQFEGLTSKANINIKNLNIKGKAKTAFNFRGAGYANLTNVKTEGEYSMWGAICWTNNCGGTLSNCTINKAFANGDSDYRITLTGNTTVNEFFANASQSNEDTAKVFIEQGSKIEKLTTGTQKDEYKIPHSTIMIDPSAWAYIDNAECEDGKPYIAEVNGVKYTNFADAVAAGGNKQVSGNNDDTATINEALKNVGIDVKSETTSRADAEAISGDSLNEKTSVTFTYSINGQGYPITFNVSNIESDATVTFGVVLYNIPSTVTVGNPVVSIN